MRVSSAAETGSELVGSMREGKLDQKHLLFGVDGSPNNYDLNLGVTGSGGWRTPRHRHNFDQIRYVIEGTLPYSETESLPQGWVGYFPESVHYGPQERSEGLRTMVLQCGGASGQGYLSVAQREAVNAELAQEGEFKKGLYTYTDKDGVEQTLDGSLAIFERAMGHTLEFAEPRYTDVIAMNPGAYEWLPNGDAGVREKWVGTFTERNLKVGSCTWTPARCTRPVSSPRSRSCSRSTGRCRPVDRPTGRRRGMSSWRTRARSASRPSKPARLRSPSPSRTPTTRHVGTYGSHQPGCTAPEPHPYRCHGALTKSMQHERYATWSGC